MVGIGIGSRWLVVYNVSLLSSSGFMLLLWWFLLVMVLLFSVNGYSVLCGSGVFSNVLVVISVVMYDVVELFMFELNGMFLLIFIVKLKFRFSFVCSDINVVFVVFLVVFSGSLIVLLWIVLMCIIGLLICCMFIVLLMFVMVCFRMLKFIVMLVIEVGVNVCVIIGVFFC